MSTDITRGTGQFPQFEDGDVHIIISGSRQYTLHSQVLRNHSTFFARNLTDEYGPPLTNRARKKGVIIQYRFRLINNPESDGNELVPVTMNGEGSSMESPPAVGLDLENGMVPDASHEAFEAILGLIYGKPISLPNFQSESAFKWLLESALELLAVAEQFEVVSSCVKDIEGHR
jgi:hypothetical protein